MLLDTYQWKITPTCLGLDVFYMLCFPHFLVVIKYPLRFFPLEHRVVIKSHRYSICITSDLRGSSTYLFLGLAWAFSGSSRLHFSWLLFSAPDASALSCSCYYSLTLFLHVSQEKILCLPDSNSIALPFIVAVSLVAPGHSSRSQL